MSQEIKRHIAIAVTLGFMSYFAIKLVDATGWFNVDKK